jgi:hypothetical protein
MEFPSGGHEISPDGIRQPERLTRRATETTSASLVCTEEGTVKRTEEIMEILQPTI